MLFLKQFVKTYYWVYLLVILCFLCAALVTTQTVSVMAVSAYTSGYTEVVIDPGHGGEDGGAISCTGVNESQINLEVSLKLRDLFHLLGYETVMTRTQDQDLATQGETIAQRKLSDLKNRVQVANSGSDRILVSIHQNLFSDGRYSGAQVFYAQTEGSKALAELLQYELVTKLNPGSNRGVKKADGVYLMQHITNPGILIECGFLSNTQEEAKLRDSGYQKELCCVIAGAVDAFLEKSENYD